MALTAYKKINSTSRQDISVNINEHIRLWGLFWATVFVIYLLPETFDYIFILFTFLLFALSKKDYFWLAYFILLNFAPFGFFSEGMGEATHRLPLFSFAPGFSFSTEHIFLFIALAKSFLKKNSVQSYFTRHYQTLLLYLLFLALVALLLHGTSQSVFLDNIKRGFYILFAYVIYKLVQTRREQYSFIYLLIPFVFLILLDATYFLISGGEYIYNYFSPYQIKEAGKMSMDTETGAGIRFHVAGFILSFIVFIYSLSINFIRKNKKYYIIAAVAAFIAILAGALRSWFVIYSIAFLFFVFYSSGKIKNTLAAGIIFLFLLLPIFQVNTGKIAFLGAFERISTVFTLGEETSAATQQIEAKITRRLPEQLQYIQENPITGWAFTEKKGDGDVGNFALIVNTGFIGFFIFLWFWISYIRHINHRIKKLKSKNAKRALKMLIVLFLGVLLSHFTTNVMFDIYKGIFLGLFVFVSEFILEEVYQYDQNYRKAVKI